MFLRVRMNDGGDEVYTILRNKALENVSYLFGEERRRMPEEDSLLVIPGLVGDYPNIMVDLKEEELPLFRERFHAADSMDKVIACWMTYGVLRNSPEFWPALDWFTSWDKQEDPIQAGRFDLKHYYLTRLLSLGDADRVDLQEH